MLKAISIAPIFASFIGALAYRTEPEQPCAGATAVQHVAVQAAEADEPLIVELGTASFEIDEFDSADSQVVALGGRALDTRVSSDDGATWSDVYEVIEGQVADPSARDRLGLLTSDLESLAYEGDGGVADFNAMLEFTMEEFWVLAEEEGSLSYGERDLVFDVLMAAIVNFPMAEGTTKWETTETLTGQKCVNRTKAECGPDDDPKRTCIKKKEMKRQKDGTYVATGKVRCESGSNR